VPRYGLVVEGPYDTPVFETLVRRLNGPDASFSVREANGHSGLMKLLPTYLKSFEMAFEGNAAERVFIIRDADMKEPQRIISDIRAVIGARTFSFPYDISVPVKEMETWLLSDVDAMNSVARNRNGRAIGFLPGDLETMQQAKEKLRIRLAEAKLQYTPAVCAEIAAHINFDTLRYRCRSFRQFSDLF
jgi:hypothetical protein